jgi:homocysteine S-methyltransferase
MTNIERLMATKTPFLTDGGFETWMFFVEGFEAPEFAALVLMDDEKAREAMRRYFDRFLGMAEAAGTGFVLDTNTWRGCPAWGPKLGRSTGDMMRLSREAVSFAKTLRENWRHRVSPILINGVLGPVGDGYRAEGTPDASTAQALHAPQIELFADEGVDMVSALTMTNVDEAIGIARTCREMDIPVVISFTLETDGRLPTGQALSDAIRQTDAGTGAAPLYYMINCAHPDHFNGTLAEGGDWVARIGGVRANASRLSHAELDTAETLDDGNPEEFGNLNAELVRSYPALRVLGGCCGSDHRHVGCVSDRVHMKTAA